MASKRSASGVAGLSISAVQLSIRRSGVATVRAAQTTGGSAAFAGVSAATTSSTLAAITEIEGRMIQSRITDRAHARGARWLGRIGPRQGSRRLPGGCIGPVAHCIIQHGNGAAVAGGQVLDYLRMDHRPVARRGAAVGAGAADQGAVSDLSRARRHGAGVPARQPVVDAGAGSGAGAVRRPGAARCRIRHLAARSARQLAAGLHAGIHRGRADHRDGRGARALAGAGHAMGRRDCARRHRGAPGCGGGDRDPAPGQAALPAAENPRRRKPAQRRQRALDLSRRRRRRRGGAFSDGARSRRPSCWRWREA